MSIQQISVFVENRPGHLQRILALFSEKDINVRGYSCSDTGDYGIARFIVDKPEKALSVLAELRRSGYFFRGRLFGLGG